MMPPTAPQDVSLIPQTDFWPQLGRFTVTTIMAIAVDMVTYGCLSQQADTMVAKAVGFCLGGVVAFVLNKYWTFKPAANKLSDPDQTKRQMQRFIGMNMVSMVGNIATNQLVLNMLMSAYGNQTAKMIGFASAVIFSTIFNYFVQKFWVFSAK
jgi:putative flippase GtrA